MSGFRNCVSCKDFVCKQLKKTVIDHLAKLPEQPNEIGRMEEKTEGD